MTPSRAYRVLFTDCTGEEYQVFYTAWSAADARDQVTQDYGSVQIDAVEEIAHDHEHNR